MTQPGGQLVTALCQVVFDIDVGQKVEAVHPHGALTPEEESDVAFHSFPDSLSMELRSKTSVRDCSFFFRIKRRPAAPGTPPHFLYGFVFCRQRQDERLRRGGEQKSVVVLSTLPVSSVLTPLARFLGPLALSYGADALEQVYEEVSCWPPPAWGEPMTLPLGEVGSISAKIPELSTLPGMAAPAAQHGGSRPSSRAGSARSSTPGSPVGARAGHLVAAAQPGDGGGGAAASAAEHDDAGWLAEMDDHMGLPLCLLPQAYGQQELVEGPFAEVDAYTPLAHVLQHLWALWEVLLLGEPLMVAAPTPTACSGAVAALLSLLAPFPYACDFRPFLTIHDLCFAPLAGGALPNRTNGLPCLLGTTNLYFIKALAGWPNVLSTGYAAAQQAQQQGSAGGGGGAAGDEGGGSGSEANGMRRSESAQSVASSSAGGGGNGGGSRLGLALRRRTQGPQTLLAEAQDSLWLSYKPFTRPDKEVLGRLVHPRPTDPAAKAERTGLLNTALLRRHFQELTQALLFPLLPYISPAPPPPAPASPADLLHPPPLPPLDTAAVLQNLGDRSGTVPDILLRRFGSSKSLVQFYQRFLESANLQAWLQTRRAVAEQWQARAWHEAWWEAGGVLHQPGTSHMGEVVTVEEYFELEQQLEQMLEVGGPEQEPSEEAQSLKAHLRRVFAAMPADLQKSLLLSPRREAWLSEGDT